MSDREAGPASTRRPPRFRLTLRSLMATVAMSGVLLAGMAWFVGLTPAQQLDVLSFLPLAILAGFAVTLYRATGSE